MPRTLVRVLDATVASATKLILAMSCRGQHKRRVLGWMLAECDLLELLHSLFVLIAPASLTQSRRQLAERIDDQLIAPHLIRLAQDDPHPLRGLIAPVGLAAHPGRALEACPG